VPEAIIRSDVDAGRFVRVFTDWRTPYPGYHHYYPSRCKMGTACFVGKPLTQSIISEMRFAKSNFAKPATPAGTVRLQSAAGASVTRPPKAWLEVSKAGEARRLAIAFAEQHGWRQAFLSRNIANSAAIKHPGRPMIQLRNLARSISTLQNTQVSSRRLTFQDTSPAAGGG
jgi:hypothetical protein